MSDTNVLDESEKLLKRMILWVCNSIWAYSLWLLLLFVINKSNLMSTIKTILSVLLVLVIASLYAWAIMNIDKRDDLYNHTLWYQEGTCDVYEQMLTQSGVTIECIKAPVLWTGTWYSANVKIHFKNK